MTATSVAEFLTNLQKSGLLTDAQIRRLRQKLAGSSRTVTDVAERLAQKKVLTQWQAGQLVKGQTRFALNQYQLLNPVGRGGMGHVFRARNTQTNAIVAVKVMAKQLVANETLVSRFRREIRANAKLQSPHIVRSLDAGRVGSVDFMVMEYVNGDQVDRLADHLGRMPVGLACEIARQVAIGLQHAHELKMVHRDIKPANIMLHWNKSGQCVVKLMDMGLVLLTADDVSEKTVTRAGQVMGTPDYMSPEQGWDTAQVDIRSDVYSLGCTLFRLLTGTVPFSGTNPLQVLGQRLQRDAPSVQSVCADLPDAVAAIVSRMTARDPDLRYQQPADAADALHPFCVPLTKAAFQNIPKTRIIDDTDKTDEQAADGTYREFLKEIQAGDATNVLLASDSTNSSNANTIPILEIDTSSSLPAIPYTKATGHEKKTRKLVLAAATLVSIVLAGTLFVLVNRSADSQNGAPSNAPLSVANTVDAPSTPKQPKVEFQTSKIDFVRAGEVWTHKVSVATSGSPGDVCLRLSPEAPVGMTIDDSNDTTLTWLVPDNQAPGPFSVRIAAVHNHAGQEITIAETVIDTVVQPTLASLTFPAFDKPLRLRVDEPFQVSLNANSASDESPELNYTASNPVPATVSLNESSGLLNWKPSLADIGRHDIDVIISEMQHPDSTKLLNVSCLVLPSKIEHVLKKLPSQTATAGSKFRFRLPRHKQRPAFESLGELVFSRTDDSPISFSVDAAKQEIVWNVPEDASGSVSISLKAHFKLSGDPRIVDLTGIAKLTIDVTGSKANSTSKATMPPEDQMTAAKVELKKTFGAAIRSARGSTERYQLAARLLTQCINGTPGASDAAFLSMIESELAEKCRATDLLLQIAEIRSTRYGTNYSEAAVRILAANRRAPLTPYQQDMIVERCLKLASDSVAESDFETANAFLQTVTSLLANTRQGSATMIASDIKSAKNIADDLAQSPGNIADTLKVGELQRLIDRWQFRSIFSKSSGFGFIQFSPAGQTASVPNSGRGLWTVGDDVVQIQSGTQPALVGIVENTLQPERFVLRFEVGPGSNCAQLLFGIAGTPNKDMNLVQVILNTSDFGRIQTLRPVVRLDDPKTTRTPTVATNQYNLVEIAVDRSIVVVRINSNVVSTAEVPGLTKGRLGFAADLRRPQPQLNIRRPRLLVIPD